ncbi:aspartate 1-decarboxylase [Jeongeupia sp. USM3]|uniref:aspartate 1-decarboxylase n=1 Tax=Jeongeupia sp. USM3 TaxID=1906741 RepID=UPI00089DFCD7|nr:aspartate 1-decarboxylase [Jeongeupia sp. USM3]AOY01485.1 aspartate 1-decarboxylase [Jeongeupia sp. USM3]
MQRSMLKSKIHRVTTTHSELNYEGSCAIDEDLLDAANILEYEEIEIWNVTNGARLATYAIRAARGSGIISVNGSAARQAQVGDLLIIATFARYDEAELKKHEPSLVFVNEANRIVSVKHSTPAQMA